MAENDELDVMQMRARDVMTTTTVACSQEAPIEYIVDLLSDREISGLPVVDRRGEVVGVLSERDIANALGGSLMRLALHRTSQTGPFLRTPRPGVARVARDLMTTPAIVVSPGTPVPEVAALMIDNGVNRIPVLADGHLVGIVTRGDILRSLRRPSSTLLSPVTIDKGIPQITQEAAVAR